MLIVLTNSAILVAYIGFEAVFEVKLRFGVDPAAKFTVLVIMKWVINVPGAIVEIIVPDPELVMGPTNLIRVRLG